jgi:hypothetical protein
LRIHWPKLLYIIKIQGEIQGKIRPGTSSERDAKGDELAKV